MCLQLSVLKNFTIHELHYLHSSPSVLLHSKKIRMRQISVLNYQLVSHFHQYHIYRLYISKQNVLHIEHQLEYKIRVSMQNSKKIKLKKSRFVTIVSLPFIALM